jgi:protein involved in polysaccharide export with SLBB domain
MRFYVMIAVIFFVATGASEADSADRNQSVRDSYTLGSGDRVKITVYGETDLSGVFEVSGTGRIAYPLIGDVEGTKIVNAVAMSGGFSYRARKQRFLVRRAGAPKDSETEAKPDDLFYPDDVIWVPERFF